MVVLKKQEMGNLKQKELELFSTAKIFNFGINSNLDEYKKFYNIASVMSFLHDEDLVNTALAFFENNLNISQTSKKTFMHRNTLVYRIEKIKKTISLDIRIFSEAVLVENMIIFYKNIISSK